MKLLLGIGLLTPAKSSATSKYVRAEVPVFAVDASGAHGRGLGELFSLNHFLHVHERGAGLGQQRVRHDKSKRHVVGNDEDETCRHRLGPLLHDQQRVSGQLKLMIAMGTSRRVFEIDGIAGISARRNVAPAFPNH